MSDAETKPVLCMQHCTNKINIFFITFPDICPVCGTSLKCCSLIIPPFRIPSPFSSQQNLSRVFVVKPTKGEFLRDYKSGDDLHVGIVASDGTVYNFDEQGLHADRHGWEQCIDVDVRESCVSSQQWDSKLQEMYCSGLWTSALYDEYHNNCFNFALNFLNQLASNKVEIVQRQDFCKNYIVPRTSKAALYIELYRRVQQSGGFSVEISRT